MVLQIAAPGVSGWLHRVCRLEFVTVKPGAHRFELDSVWLNVKLEQASKNSPYTLMLLRLIGILNSWCHGTSDFTPVVVQISVPKLDETMKDLRGRIAALHEKPLLNTHRLDLGVCISFVFTALMEPLRRLEVKIVSLQLGVFRIGIVPLLLFEIVEC